ncbi:hypothetical protein [Fluoribacter dumoffii]|uniref:Uncharacterized protein n=1 Tax=Fluoribacter dumoffii TaxID=463 RepID=A0A377IVY4_9GAMM|nr:hypothetical protein [Fluoribacter dumoffii]STO91705.1 Uncharacterised protein [Fluoribacter dumoffii]
MLDREEDEVTLTNKVTNEYPKGADKEFFEAVQTLKSVTLLLKGLYGQMNEEREVITLASGQMAHSVKQFEQHLIQFEAFEKACKQSVIERIKTELKQNIRESAQTIAQEVADFAYEPINHSMNSLCQLSKELTGYQARQKSSRRGSPALLLSAALLGGVVSGFTLHYLTAPSKEMKVKLAAGEALMRSWNKLTKAEQEKIFPSKS